MKNDTESVRLFFALWPDEQTRANLQRLQAGLHGRLIRTPDLHITLAFLGKQPLSSLPLLKQILADLPQTDLVLQIDRLGYFKRNRIAWAGTHAVPDGLRHLQTALAEALEKAGIDFDSSKDFKPHITLARDAELPPDRTFDEITWQVTQAVLVQSQIPDGGNGYRVLAERCLQKAG